jgi:kynureninase
MSETSKSWCESQDTADPLAAYRTRFDIPEGIIYLDGNSLGVLPDGVADRLAHVVTDEWRTGLVKSWNDAGWVDLPLTVGAKIAALIGAGPNDVVMTDSTSINLFKTAAAACKLNPGRLEILSEPGNFPTDLYMMQGLTKFLGDDYTLTTAPRDAIKGAITNKTAVLVLTHVHYVSADMYDMKAITKAAHDKGALVVWDLSHSAGAVPVDLTASDADFAVGCGYKYLNGGPGAPGFLYVAPRHQKTALQPLSGWFGHQVPFDFVDDYQPAKGIKRMQTGTPCILGASALDSALEAFSGVDMRTVRTKSTALSELFIRLVDTRLKGFGVTLASPRDSSARGSHVSLRHENSYAVMQALIEHGVIGDFRAPDHMRFGFTPLYIGYTDIYRAVEILENILATEIWREPRFGEKNAVT